MAKNVKKTLGRGIDALISVDTQNDIKDDINIDQIFLGKKKEIIEIEIEKLSANPFQPRRYFDEQKLKELSLSITQHGILEPILVTKKDKNLFIIIAGERRFKAAKIAGLTSVPCIVLSVSDEENLEITIIENLQRENLNPIEMANSFKNIMTVSKISQEELAKKLGISRPVVSNFVRLLSLTDEIQTAIKTNEISQSHARILLSIDDEKKRNNFFEEIIRDKLSVRQLEEKLNSEKLYNKKSKKQQVFSKKTELTVYEQQFIEFFGSKVSLSGNLNKGSIKIEYYNAEDFSRILTLLNLSLD